MKANENPDRYYMMDVRDEIAAAMTAATGIEWTPSSGGHTGVGLSFYAELESTHEDGDTIHVRVSDHDHDNDCDVDYRVESATYTIGDEGDDDRIRLYADDTDTMFAAAAVAALKTATAIAA